MKRRMVMPWSSSGFAVAALALAFAGCFKSPDVDKIICTGDSSCPGGYTCTIPAGSKQGACVRSTSEQDVGGDLRPILGEVGSPVDLSPWIDGAGGPAVDQASAGSMDGPGGGALDVAVDTGTATPDVPPVEVDAAQDSPPDPTMPSPDTRDVFVPDLPLGPDTPACNGAGSCCSDSDCTGICQTCSANHTCVSVINADDPNHRCSGTCDATGACKDKKGQACDAVSGGCVSGTTCSPENICCDKACTGSCEACDISGSAGTCTTLGTGAPPHSGHTACTATSSECAGTCNGSSVSCSYTTATCGTATCTGTSYTPAGICSNGACTPGTTRTCGNNQTCSNNACACVAPNVTCGDACVNTATDASNCGSCGHSCQGGTCSGGLCQPIAMTSGLSGYSFVFGVDSQYVYYSSCSDSYTCTPMRIVIGVTGGTGSALTSTTCSGIGVIGNTLLLFENQVADFLCTIGTDCAPTSATRFADGFFGRFKSPSPAYFTLTSYANASTETTTWYTNANSAQSTFSWGHSGNLSSFAQVGNAVYWIEAVDSSTYKISGTVGFPASTTHQVAGSITYNANIIDANSQSLIVQDNSSNALYRVPLPGGLGTASPQAIVGTTATGFVTEDVNGIYWIDSLGNVNRCSAPACSSNTTLATGQVVVQNAGLGGFSPLYQDSTSLYWINGNGDLIRLPK